MDNIKNFDEFNSVNEELVVSPKSLKTRALQVDGVNDVEVEKGDTYVKLFFRTGPDMELGIIHVSDSGKLSGETSRRQEVEYKKRFDVVGEDDILQALRDWMNHLDNWNMY